MIESVIKPLQPRADALGWESVAGRLPSLSPMGYPFLMFRHLLGFGVISAVEVAKDDDGIERGPEYHISISKNGGRCTAEEAQLVLKDFGLEGAEEDNHVPSGFVRNFWRPVADPMVGLECACKESEPKMVEDKGDFVWRG